MFTDIVERTVGAMARAEAQNDGFGRWHQVTRRVEHRDFIAYCIEADKWVIFSKKTT